MKTREGRILRILGGSYRVELDDPIRQVECTLRGRVKQGEDDERLAVGDFVEVELLEDGDCRIARRLPRRSQLTRRRPTGRGDQTILANADQVAVVTAVRQPEPDRQLIDRLLVVAELNGLDALVVANKVDLLDAHRDDDGSGAGAVHGGDGGAVDEAARDHLDDYRAAGYEVLPTSAATGRNLDTLDSRLSSRTTVFTGASGVGKSALLNALIPGLDRRVGEMGRKGRHTTVSAAMIRYDEDGYVADTPGLQYLALGRVEPPELAAAFPEIRARLSGCRFTDCRHLQEPGCPVRDAVDSGEISQRRYESYRSLLEESLEEEPW